MEGIGLPLPIAVRVEYSTGQAVNAGDLAHHLEFIGCFSSCSRAQILNVLPDSKSLKYVHSPTNFAEISFSELFMVWDEILKLGLKFQVPAFFRKVPSFNLGKRPNVN